MVARAEVTTRPVVVNDWDAAQPLTEVPAGIAGEIGRDEGRVLVQHGRVHGIGEAERQRFARGSLFQVEQARFRVARAVRRVAVAPHPLHLCASEGCPGCHRALARLDSSRRYLVAHKIHEARVGRGHGRVVPEG